ncbi:extensin [Streptomyces scabiei]|uniref:extensin n=1 Tax=Streptomyces scabiei TaxID=1930 RepID=UPI003403916E
MPAGTPAPALVRPLTPTRALTSALPTATAPPVLQRQAARPAVPLRRPAPTHDHRTAPAAAPAVQRLTANQPAKPRPAPRPARPTTPPVVPRVRAVAPTPPPAPAPPPSATPTPVQRAPQIPLRPTPATTTSAVSPVTASATSAASSATTPAKTSRTSTPPPGAPFDPRTLTDFQLDELTHKLIGRITRLVRTELRLDRERIGRLRDPRH